MATKEGRNNFVEELCKYYMHFLQNGFKSQTFPKRSIKYTNEKNFKVGINLSKYEKFNEYVRKLLSKPNGFQNDITIKKGTYSVKLNDKSLDLVKKLVKQIKDKDVEKIVLLSVKTIKEFALSHRNRPDEAYDKINEVIKKDITNIIIKPITEKIEPLIGSQSNFEIESLYTLEEKLTDLILDPLSEGIPLIFNNILADKKYKPKDHTSELFNKNDICSRLLDLFINFEVKDLYYDLQEIVNSFKNLDKKEIYLYFGEIEVEKRRFPLFYSQINVKEYSTESVFKISFSNEFFVNKRAIDFAFQTLLKEDKKVEKFDEERKLTVTEDNTLLPRLNDIYTSLISKLRTNGDIDLSDTKKQLSKNIYFVLSNNCSFCVFDKSDESLINDYENILEKLLQGDSDIAEMFKQLITDFLLKEPEVINQEVEDNWDGLDITERLNYESPIPLNPEQQKIIRSLKNEKCKYVTVEGPPGTGKSHTISAIAFDYILKNKSILILSDTREALDVVEEKIDQTLNQVRRSHNVQNPILRLGKMGNTYNKILAKSSIDNLRDFHRAQRSHSDKTNENIKQISDVVNDRLQILSDHYKNIDKDKFEEFEEISKSCSKEDLSIDASIIKAYISENSINPEDFNFENFIDSLNEISDLEIIVERIKDTFGNTASVENILDYFDFISLLDNFVSQDKNSFKCFDYFGNISTNNISYLYKKLEEYKEETAGFFGGVFKGGKIVELSEQIKKKLNIKKNINLKTDFDKLKTYNDYLSQLKDFIENKKLNFDRAIKIIRNYKSFNDLQQDKKYISKYFHSLKIICNNKNLSKNLGINSKKINSIFENKFATFDKEKKELIKKYYSLENFFTGIFDHSENFDYATLMKKLQSLHTTKMTDVIDGGIIKFYDNNKNTARSLSKIIRAKQKFPKEQFQKLKNAFPCIISSVRDFSEYIDLDMGMFDLIIIDEASQVSIAQAFPAIIRAKKILVLGDKKQFSNLQSYQATSIINNTYQNKLRKVFRENISRDAIQLERLASFNVKTSILDFFQRISNYEARLKKHFRGYPEHIAYCSKTFYNNDLQAIRLRTKPVNQIIHFENLKYEIKDETNNSNEKEAEHIIKELEKIKSSKILSTVGVITPFTDQQQLITRLIQKHKDKDYFEEQLQLKIMTFDTCQGREKQIIFYSMVATQKKDKLNWIFPVDLANKDLEEYGDKKAQRLNVGLSRVQEKMYFVLSKPVDEFKNEIGNALRFINNIWSSKEKLPNEKDLDPKSPMEKEVLQWFKQSSFYLENKNKIELKSQFPIGDYFKQIYPDYHHPKFVVDFLVIYRDENNEEKKVVIEYDGLKEHFDNKELVTDSNYEDYYTVDHEERQKILESYGVIFIRLNKFVIKENPIKYLDKQLKQTFSKRTAINISQHKKDIADLIEETIKKTKDGKTKHCDKCKEYKPIADFKDPNLRSGIGIVCVNCKGGFSRKSRKKNVSKKEFKSKDVRFKWQEGKEYKISYVNASGWASQRTVKIRSIDNKFIHTYDYQTNENRTFRKDRVKESKLA